jgi:hypothetical protein
VSEEKDRKQLSYAERASIAAEINQLLEVRDSQGKKKYSQGSLGKALGGLSQETVRRSKDPSNVGPAVKEGLLRLLGTTIEEVMIKHGAPPDPAEMKRISEEALAANPLAGMFEVAKAPELRQLQKLAIAILLHPPYDYDVVDAWRMTEGLLYARKHTTDITPGRLAQLAHLTEMELRGKPIGAIEDEKSLPAPPAAQRPRRAK